MLLIKICWFVGAGLLGLLVLTALCIQRVYQRPRWRPRYRFRWLQFIAGVISLVMWSAMVLPITELSRAAVTWLVPKTLVCLAYGVILCLYISLLSRWAWQRFGRKVRRRRKPAVQQRSCQSQAAETESNTGLALTPTESLAEASMSVTAVRINVCPTASTEPQPSLIMPEFLRNYQASKAASASAAEQQTMARARAAAQRFNRPATEMEQDLFVEMMQEMLRGQADEVIDIVQGFFANDPSALLQALCPEYVVALVVGREGQVHVKLRSATAEEQKRSASQMAELTKRWHDRHSTETAPTKAEAVG